MPADVSEPAEEPAQAAPDRTVKPTLPKKPNKKRKTVQMAEEAFNVMKKVSASLDVRDNDEFDVFGNHVACQVRNLSSKFDQAQAKFEINQILYEFEMKQLQSGSSDSRPSSACTSRPSNTSVDPYVIEGSDFSNHEDDFMSRVYQHL